MKTITIPVQDDVYQKACAEAARRQKSLAELIGDLMAGLRGEPEACAESAPRDADLQRRRQWLDQLRETRSTMGAQRSGGSSTEEVFDDIRSERC